MVGAVVAHILKERVCYRKSRFSIVDVCGINGTDSGNTSAISSVIINTDLQINAVFSFKFAVSLVCLLVYNGCGSCCIVPTVSGYTGCLSACGKADTVGSAIGHHIPELHVSARGKLNGGIASVSKTAADNVTRLDSVIIGIKLH